MTEETIAITVSDRSTVTAVRTPPEHPSHEWLFIYAPGAGANVNDGFGRYVCRHLAGHGIAAVRFQFPYMEDRKRRPDAPRILEATWRKVIEHERLDHVRLAVGGRSMGGRIASQVVAQGISVDALALFAYPLRPPYAPTKTRDGHLPAINVPTLFCSGTRDAFGSPDELKEAADKVPNYRLHLLDDADHGFGVRKSTGLTREHIWSQAATVLSQWLSSL